MAEQKYFLITKEDVEVILNKVRRLSWDDANEVMARIKDLKAVSVKETEDEDQEELFKNKFSGTSDRNEEEKEGPKEVLPPSVTTDKNWGGDGTPVY